MDFERAWKAALEARERAYAPYSNFKVGAALKLKGIDELILGCNVENASYGGTICAERSAVVSGVSQYGKQELEYIVVATGTSPASPPCAFCLGVLAEFASADLPVILGNPGGIDVQLRLGDLLPSPFRL